MDDLRPYIKLYQFSRKKQNELFSLIDFYPANLHSAIEIRNELEELLSSFEKNIEYKMDINTKKYLLEIINILSQAVHSKSALSKSKLELLKNSFYNLEIHIKKIFPFFSSGLLDEILTEV